MLKLFDPVFVISQFKGNLLKLQVFSVRVLFDLAKCLHHLGHLILKHLLILLFALHHLNVLVELLVQLLGIRQLSAEIGHLLNFLLVDLNDSLAPFELPDLLFHFFQFVGKPVDRVLILSLNEHDLVFKLSDTLVLLVHLVRVLVLISCDLLVHLLTLSGIFFL